METKYGGYTVAELREFIRHHYDDEHGGDNIDELTSDSSSSVKIVRDLLDAIEPPQGGELLAPVARWVYQAVRVNLDLLHGICMEHGCGQGEDVADWLRVRLAPAVRRRVHCQEGGDVCLAGSRDGVCCPEDSCDIDDGVRKVPTLTDEQILEIGRQFFRPGHKPEAEPAFVNAVRAMLATQGNRAPIDGGQT